MVELKEATMPHSFGREIDDIITEFRQQLAAQRKTHVAEMQKEIIAPLRAMQAEVDEMSRDIVQLRLVVRQMRLRNETTSSRDEVSNRSLTH